jgi:hypothetical protein
MEIQLFDISNGLLAWAVLAGLLFFVVPAGLGTYLAAGRRRHPLLGLFAGPILSWIGVILLLLVMQPLPAQSRPPLP